jgi:DNA-directed RNA polymerase alpha subunit
MIPVLVNDFEDEQGLHFVIKDIPLAVANAIRRTILSDIPTLVIRTENSKINQCTVLANTSRFHNEIVKQRLSCIPIHSKELETFPEKYRLIVQVKNDSVHELRWVTTKDFKIQDKTTEQFMDETEVSKLFPVDSLSNQPIDFLRLRPGIGSTVQGEQIHLVADFSVSNAKENGMFNVVSKCAFSNVVDVDVREKVWSVQLQTLKDENRTAEEIEFERKNYMNLDAYRCFKTDEHGEPNEFDFLVKTVGIYTNYEILFLACEIVEKRFHQFVHEVQSQVVPIHESKDSPDLGYTTVTVSSIENSFDVILEGEDYTFGYLLEHYLHAMFYSDDSNEELVYIGFKKYHPHDTFSVIRMAFQNPTTAALLAKQYLIQASTEIAKVMQTLKEKARR